MSKVHLIGIAGGSCSGKTRLLKRVVDRLGDGVCSVLLQDNYYHSQPGAQKDNLKFNFDHPDAIDFTLLARDLNALRNGRDVLSPHYDFAKHVRVAGKGSRVSPKPIVLLDGILILTDEAVREALDHRVYIHCDAEERLRRRIARDVAERGRTRDNVIAQFRQQVDPMHQRHVRPSAQHADVCYEEAAVTEGEAFQELLTHCQSQLSRIDR